MKSFQLSLAIILSLIFFFRADTSIQAQGPTTAPTTQKEKIKTTEAKRKAVVAAKEKARRTLSKQKIEYCTVGPGIFYESQIVEIKREVLERGIPENLDYKGTVVFNICINRSGIVIYSKYNRNKSTITNREALYDALSAMKKTKFAADSSAQRKVCGQWTFTYHKGTIESGIKH